ncbi:hypothetical protein CPB85DRAFT_1218204 [Mucidula mucida]|nr:hypothetical protein CPB85DRAFT_1218204 [Mucidula mucida]
MNRHHPYGENPMRHAGASPPSGFGPDRSHRGSYRGGGRGGRGRGAGHNSFQSGKMNGNFNAYDQPPPDMGYGGYGNMQPQAPPQDPYYQNYGPGTSAPYPPMNSSGYAAAPGYNNNKYEGSYDGDSGGYGQGGARRPPPPPRKDREDKVHDSIIEERIQRERPCRTLFIRNIKASFRYETNSDDVRRSFEEHGDIKTFFDLISTRGMVFVTYFDLRAAERARERLQDTEISGRPIDVHYSLPRDDSKDAKNIEMQGSLQVTLRSSPSGQAIDDNEVRRKFQQFGDVKSVRPVGNRIDSRYVEYYDTRACFEAHDRLRHQGLQDGVMDIVFAWDTAAEANGTGGHR